MIVEGELLRTVVENRTGLDETYRFDGTNLVCSEDNILEQRSCFYDFGARKSACFSGISMEPESAFVEALRTGFFGGSLEE